MIFLLCLGVFFLTQAKAELQSSDVLVMFALPGGSITLPCAINSIKSCSSINWDRAEFSWFGSMVVARAGTVTATNAHRFRLLNDCSLQINNMVTDDARIYTCNNGKLNSSVAVPILELTENSSPPKDQIELQCYLNIHKGLAPCKSDTIVSQIQLRWTAEDDTPINGDRFQIENPSNCFSKLFISKKPTDHLRKWKCHLFQNDSHKATTSHSTIITDGIEEVFATVGESVSFSCSNTSSLGLGGEARPQPIFENKSSLSLITKVSASHSGDYKCSDSTSEQHKRFRLHTIDITSEYGPEGNNLTLTCVLTCANRKCENDFNLTWSQSDPNSWQSGLMKENHNLINRLVFPVLPMRSDETVCSARRDGAVVASKKWPSVKSLHNAAWLALPLGLLICIAAGGLYLYVKRKHNKKAENEQADIGMTHVYEDIQDADNEERQQPRQFKREASTTDSFYDLLQAVN